MLGNDGPDLMCALLRAGAPNVTDLRSFERPEADSASLVIVPNVPSLDWLANALPRRIRRALHDQWPPGNLHRHPAHDAKRCPPHADVARSYRDPHQSRGGASGASRRTARVRHSPVRLKGTRTMRNIISGVGGS